MIWPLRWRKVKGSTPENEAPLMSGALRPQVASELLDTPRRQRVLEHIWQKTSLSRKQFQRLYLEPIERFAALVQHIPASQNHHHAYPGGMLDHGLEIMAYALKLRQSHLLPLGAAPEAQAAQAEVWTAAVAYAALLHDVGKIVVDVEVVLDDGRCWHPWHGPITRDYRIRYPSEREYRLHSAAAGLVYMQILPSRVLDWLSATSEVWTPFVFLLAGQYEHAGILGELVVLADRASVAQELGANPDRAISAAVGSLQRQLVDGLRLLVKEQLKLNEMGAADGWLTTDALWLVSKTVADKLRAHLLAQGTEGIPSSNPVLFNLLQDQGLILPNDAGKAIWKAVVVAGNWEQTLTFIKISPALIWNGNDRPEAFSGSVTSDLTASSGDISEEKTLHMEPVSAMPPKVGCINPDSSSSAALCLPDTCSLAPPQADEVDLLINMLSVPQAPLATSSIQTDGSCKRVHDSDKGSSSESVGMLSNISYTFQEGFDRSRLGLMFMDWLRKGIINHKIVINDARAKIHTVSGTAFLVTPELFQRYAQEHVELTHHAKEEGISDWRMVQRAFEKMDIHKKRWDGLNIWTCEIQGPRKTRNLKGYLLKEPSSVFASVPYDNPYLRLLTSSQEEAGL